MAEKTNGAAAPQKTQSGGISKTEAVRSALRSLGNDAMPLTIQGYVKKHFGIEMTASHVSNCKSEIFKQAGKAKKPAAPQAAASQAGIQKATKATVSPAAVKAAAPKSAPKTAAAKPAAPKPAAKAGSASYANGKASGIGLNDIPAVKELVGRVGADSLKTLIDLLSK